MSARIQSPMHCVHCNTTETPLWRAGPAGPKTLCNACGVRWKKTGSVIPRAKRMSAAAAAGATSAATPAVQHSTANHPNASAHPNPHSANPSKPHTPLLRKRARPSSHNAVDEQTTLAQERQDRPSAPIRETVDPSARVAAASMPAPRPISVFRISDAHRSKYESVFSGLMVVHRPREVDETRAMRTRTHTPKASAFFSEAAAPSTNGPSTSAREETVPPSPSPPPIDLAFHEHSVYVTEVHAPSPSPSPPPMPKVQRLNEGRGFRLVVATVNDERKRSTGSL